LLLRRGFAFLGEWLALLLLLLLLLLLAHPRRQSMSDVSCRPGSSPHQHRQ
jgi:hypothetical protein